MPAQPPPMSAARSPATPGASQPPPAQGRLRQRQRSRRYHWRHGRPRGGGRLFRRSGQYDLALHHGCDRRPRAGGRRGGRHRRRASTGRRATAPGSWSCNDGRESSGRRCRRRIDGGRQPQSRRMPRTTRRSWGLGRHPRGRFRQRRLRCGGLPRHGCRQRSRRQGRNPHETLLHYLAQCGDFLGGRGDRPLNSRHQQREADRRRILAHRIRRRDIRHLRSSHRHAAKSNCLPSSVPSAITQAARSSGGSEKATSNGTPFRTRNRQSTRSGCLLSFLRRPQGFRAGGRKSTPRRRSRPASPSRATSDSTCASVAGAGTGTSSIASRSRPGAKPIHPGFAPASVPPP